MFQIATIDNTSETAIFVVIVKSCRICFKLQQSIMGSIF